MVINAGLPEKKRIAYRSLTGQLNKPADFDNSLPPPPPPPPPPPLPQPTSSTSPFPLMSAENALQTSCSSSSLSHVSSSSLSTIANLDTLDVATKQLWNHYRIRGGFFNDREFILHLLQKEQSCRECNTRNSITPGSDASLWHQKATQEFKSNYDIQSTSSNSAKITDRSSWMNDQCESEENSARVSVSEAVMLFKEWLQEKNLSTEFEKFPKTELNDLLGQYYQDVSEEYGVEYKWATLDGIRSALEKHLSSCSNPVNIVNDVEFKGSNEILQSFVKKRRYDENNGEKKPIPAKMTKTPGPSESESQTITTEDLLKIHTSLLLTTDNPEGLLHKVWFDLILFLGIFCGQNPSLHSLKLNADPDNSEFYCFYNDNENNDNGLRMYGSSGNHCPLAALKKYLSKLHPDQEQLFQHPNPNWSPESDIWYSPEPMSPDDLESVADFLLRSTGLSKCYSLASLHATSEWVQELWENGKDRETILTLTGLLVESSAHNVEIEVQRERDEIKTSLLDSTNASNDLDEMVKKIGRAPTSPTIKCIAPTSQSMLLLPNDHFSSFVQSGMHLSSMLPSTMLLPVPFQEPNPLPSLMYLKPEQSSKRIQDFRSDIHISINSTVPNSNSLTTT
uniref:DUF3504 domain-containing protein n=1 Tax=Strigamia maritima TaxID=126957 RepID=T1II71_STRMM